MNITRKKTQSLEKTVEETNHYIKKFQEKVTPFIMPQFLKDITNYKPISFVITPDNYIYIHKTICSVFREYVETLREVDVKTANIAAISKIDYINIFFQNFMVTINITEFFNNKFMGLLDKTKHPDYVESISAAVHRLFTMPIVSLFSLGNPSPIGHDQILKHLQNSNLKEFEFLRNPYISAWYNNIALVNPALLLNLFNSYHINAETGATTVAPDDAAAKTLPKEFCPNFYNLFINPAPNAIFPYITTQIDFWTPIFMYKTGYLQEHLDNYKASGEQYSIPKSPRNYIFTTILFSEEFVQASGTIEKSIQVLENKVTTSKVQIDNTDKLQTFIYRFAHNDLQKKENLEKYFDNMRNTTDYLSLVHHALDENIWDPNDRDDSLDNFSSIVKINTSKVSKEISGFTLLKNEFTRRKAYCNNLQLPISYSVFLVGPTGVGKTEIAKWIAASEERELYLFNIGSIQNMYVGETERQMDEVIAKLKELKNSVILLDEIEKEITASNDANGTFARIANRLMKFLEENKNQIIIATANNAKVIRPELMRRFDSSFRVSYPIKEQLKNIISVINTKKFQSEIFTEKYLEELTTTLINKDKYSPDDIAHICMNAHIEEVISGKKITPEEFKYMALNHITTYSKEKDKIETLQSFYKDYPDVNQEEKKFDATKNSSKKTGI